MQINAGDTYRLGLTLAGPDYSANISLIYYIGDGIAKNHALTTFSESAVNEIECGLSI
jgi:hypothetical protein